MSNNLQIIREEMHREKFSDEDWKEREECFHTVKHWGEATKAAEKALIRIRDKGFFRPYRTLTECCEKEFGWSKRRAQQIIKGIKVVEALPEQKRTLVTTERQARELAKHPEEQRAEILEEAVKFHAKDGKMTAKDIERAAVTLEPVDQTDFPIPSGDASYYWSLLPQGKELAAKIHAIGMTVKALDADDTFWRLCDLPSVLTDLRSAWKRLKGGLPAYVCTKCGGVKPKGCDFCKGRGTVGTWAWRNCGDDKHAIERAVREARKKNASA